jgi:thymidine kinase
LAQLYFKYGTTNSGKSIEILKVKHNYEEQDKIVILYTSALDSRSGKGRVASRIGISSEAIALNHDDSIKKSFNAELHKLGRVDCVLVDEAQFLSRDQVIYLSKIANNGTPVMCFGLKNDFKNELFEGSEALLTFADKIEEIKTICWDCSKKAIMNVRTVNGEMVTEGDQIEIGGNESYIPVCRKHYFERLKVVKSKEKRRVYIYNLFGTKTPFYYLDEGLEHYQTRKIFNSNDSSKVYNGRRLKGVWIIESGNVSTSWTPAPVTLY